MTLVITPASGVSAYAVEDTLPTGFTATNIVGSGDFESVNRKVKWGPFFDNTARTLSYTLVAPAGFAGTASIAGVGSFDGLDVPIVGPSRVLSSSVS